MADSTFLDNIVAAWGGSEADIPDRERDPFPDETRSPHINNLIRTARQYLVGLIRRTELLNEIQLAVDRLKKALNEHRAFYDQYELTEEVREIADRADSAYIDFSFGLSSMVDSLPLEDLSLVEKGIETCKTAALTLEQCNDRFLELQKLEMRVNCPSCEHPNEPHYRQCVKCNAPLPASPEDEDSGDMVMVPEDYMHLYEACDKVAAGEIPLAAWQAHIDRFVEGFEQTRNFVGDQFRLNADQLDGVPGLKDEAEALLESLEEAEAALCTMQEFADDGDPEHLNQGWFDLLKATQKIQRDGMNFYRTLEAIDHGDLTADTPEGHAEVVGGRAGDEISFGDDD